jgi:hypothetical protein
MTTMTTKTWYVSITHWNAISSLVLDIPDTGDAEADAATAVAECKKALVALDLKDRVRCFSTLGKLDRNTSMEKLTEEAEAYCNLFNYSPCTVAQAIERVPGIERHIDAWRTPELPSSPW